MDTLVGFSAVFTLGANFVSSSFLPWTTYLSELIMTQKIATRNLFCQLSSKWGILRIGDR